MRKLFSRLGFILAVFVLQFVPLVIFPASSYAADTQEWWLPVLISVMALIATVQLLFRYRPVPWPWYILNFAQGTNVISRLMLLMPHASVYVQGVIRLNVSYVVVTFVSILMSAFFIWYFELPEVRRAVTLRFGADWMAKQEQGSKTV